MRYAHYWRTAIKVLFIYFNLCLSVKMDSLSCTGNYVRSPCRVRFYYWIYSFTILSFFFCCKTNQTNQYAGADPGFQVRGAHLKKLRRAEGGAKILGGGGNGAPGARHSPPGSAPDMKSNVCNSLNYSAQYLASWLTINDLYLFIYIYIRSY